MADRVLIPFNGALLALTVEQYVAARDAAAEFTPVDRIRSAPDIEPLLDADTAATQLGVTARWLEDSARAGIVPYHKLGRFIRFRVSEIAAHCRVDGAAAPTDSQSVRPIRRLARQ
jgi:hypothetical protein